MRIESKWSGGKYYNAAKLIKDEESNKKYYWGIAGSSMEVKRSPEPFLDTLSKKVVLGGNSQFRTLDQKPMIDSFEEEMIARIAASTILTKEQLIDFMKLRGLLQPVSDSLIEPWIMERRLKKLLDLQLLEQVTISYTSGRPSHKAYRITELGQKLAHRKGVRIHKGNMYQTSYMRMKTGLLDTPTQAMRMLVANNIAIQLLDQFDDIERFEFMYTLHMEGEITLRTINRSALSVIRDDGTAVLYEVIRKPDPLNQTTDDFRNYEKYITDKISRYLTLVQRQDFAEKNSLHLETIPKLAIVAEDFNHMEELKKLLSPFIKHHRTNERAEILFLYDSCLEPDSAK